MITVTGLPTSSWIDFSSSFDISSYAELCLFHILLIMEKLSSTDTFKRDSVGEIK